MEYKVGALSKSFGTGRKLSPKKNALVKLFSKVSENQTYDLKEFIHKPSERQFNDEKLKTNCPRKRKRKLSEIIEDEDDDIPESKKKSRNRKNMLVMKHDENPEYLSRTVFVGNLPVAISKKQVTKIFKKYGNIEAIWFRSLGVADPSLPKKVSAITKDYHKQRQNMNAYIRFENEDSAKKAQELNGLKVEDFPIRVDLANNQTHDRKCSVFIGNLPFDIQENDLYSNFSECGAIQGVRVVREPKTGVGRGFGFVTFESSDAVEIAVHSLNGSSIKGRNIRVYRAVTKDKATKLSIINKKAAIRRKAEDSKRKRKAANKERKKFSKVKKDNDETETIMY